MDYLAEREPGMYGSLGLVLVEREPSLESAQAGMLGGHACRTRWMTPEEFAGSGFALSGCLYSNELLDALPVHRVVMTADAQRFVTALPFKILSRHPVVTDLYDDDDTMDV